MISCCDDNLALLNEIYTGDLLIIVQLHERTQLRRHLGGKDYNDNTNDTIL